ncbi:uncharacterized protein N7483_000751 [Penicillium malachiteum]|uniref:uncharacterized protein n=1 Tax=Penicillium malachiteum TaxID=1324776 RepID=UPI0025495227|nr:uncharacterized protein N7483_000751 [Penicillium malachiteum]KAJ5735626.1 hypothetical protein N7483_000751 [Penicillium malachiteum]
MSYTRRLWKPLVATTAGGIVGLGSFFVFTRHAILVPIEPTDRINQVVQNGNFNPHRNPVVEDKFVRRIPLDQINPRLLENPQKLNESFYAGVWSGPGMSAPFSICRSLLPDERGLTIAGFSIQRTLSRIVSSDDPSTPKLWSRDELAASTYEQGTWITSSLEVYEKTPEAIVIRGGDTEIKDGLKGLDAFMELSSAIKKEEGVVEFGLRSIFFTGTDATGTPALPGFAVWLHLQYAKLLLVTGTAHFGRQ